MSSLSTDTDDHIPPVDHESSWKKAEVNSGKGVTDAVSVQVGWAAAITRLNMEWFNTIQVYFLLR